MSTMTPKGIRNPLNTLTQLPINLKDRKWDRSNKKEVAQNKTSKFNPENLRNGLYRPFCKQWLYFDRQCNK